MFHVCDYKWISNILVSSPLCFLQRDTYVKEMAGETPNDRNDRGLSFPFSSLFKFRVENIETLF